MSATAPKLETVRDVMEVHDKCIELSSRLESMNNDIRGLLQPAKDALTEASAILDFFAEEVLPSLRVFG